MVTQAFFLFFEPDQRPSQIEFGNALNSAKLSLSLSTGFLIKVHGKRYKKVLTSSRETSLSRPLAASRLDMTPLQH